MSFPTEPPGYIKTILSDLQGAWIVLRESIVNYAGFPEWNWAIFHIDEAMSWETVRNLERMPPLLLIIRNLCLTGQVPDEVIENIDDDLNYFTDVPTTLVIDDKPLKVQHQEDLSHQQSRHPNSNFGNTNHNDPSTLKERSKLSHFNPDLAIENGKKGEEIAKDYLRKKKGYEDEIIDWNAQGSGKGYDFIRKGNLEK